MYLEMTRETAGLIWWGWIAAYLLIRTPHVWRAKKQAVRTSERDIFDWIARTAAVIGLGIVPGAYTVTKFPQAADIPFTPALAWVGTALCVLAAWLFWRTHRDLALGFSNSLEIRSEHRLVTTGVYAFVRHPMYAAFWLWAIAQALVLQNAVVALAGLMGMAYLFVHRMRREERLMLAAFGAQYQAYMQRTARLIPGIY